MSWSDRKNRLTSTNSTNSLCPWCLLTTKTATDFSVLATLELRSMTLGWCCNSCKSSFNTVMPSVVMLRIHGTRGNTKSLLEAIWSTAVALFLRKHRNENTTGSVVGFETGEFKAKGKNRNPKYCDKTVMYLILLCKKKKTLCISESTNYFTRLNHSSHVSLSLTSLLIVFSINYRWVFLTALLMQHKRKWSINFKGLWIWILTHRWVKKPSGVTASC